MLQFDNAENFTVVCNFNTYVDGGTKPLKYLRVGRAFSVNCTNNENIH